MLSNEEKREKKFLEKELLTILSLYKEVAWRSEKVKAYFDDEIERIIKALKELGR